MGIFRRIQRVHFVGIGGIGMCGIAELLHNQGVRVSGSDLREGATVARLRHLGIPVSLGHAAQNVGDAEVLVYSSAVRATNAELREAEARKIPVIPRAEMLAEVMRLKHGIAVAGTHGKTTTTSLISHVLEHAGLDPTAVIGGRVLAPGADPGDASDSTGTKLGRSELLVAEADESDGSFLRLAPVIAVVTNVDPEHLDHYGSVEALHDAFVEFANRVPFWGASILCLDHPGVRQLLPRLTRRTITYGFTPHADLVGSAIEVDGFGMRFEVGWRGEPQGSVRIGLIGEHNVANALATLAVALELDVEFDVAAQALASFVGIERRFQRKGTHAGVSVVDDYAHHPVEVRATLAAARSVYSGRIVAVFQPHRYSRTRDCFDEFVQSFHDADLLVLTEIYAAGEDKLPGVSSQALADAVRAHGHGDVRYVAELEDLPDALAAELREGDLVLTLGAGNISTLGTRLLTALQERRS